jgi:tetratricopeptide (TPR) repeat protein
MEDSLAVRRAINDRWAIAVTLNNIGFLALLQGRVDEARPALEEALALQREVGDRWMIGNALNNLGNVARDQAAYGEARALYAESLAIYRVLGDKCALAYLLEDTARLAALEGQPHRALCLAAAAWTLRAEIRAPLTDSEAAQLEGALAPAREALGDAAQAAWAEGLALSLPEAMSLALGS